MEKRDKEKIIIADSDALDRFIKTGNTHVLPSLYDRVVIPEQVYRELTREQTPREVREWTERQSRERTWLHVAKDPIDNPQVNSRGGGWGEKQAMALAHEYQKSERYQSVALLLEDRRVLPRARKENLDVTRGLFLLDEADKRRLIRPLPEEIKRLEDLPIDYKYDEVEVDGEMVPMKETLLERYNQRQEYMGRIEMRNVPSTRPNRRDFIASFPSGKQGRLSVGGLSESEDVKESMTFIQYQRLEQQSHEEVLDVGLGSAQQHGQTQHYTETPQHTRTQNESQAETQTQTESPSIKF
jgi:predicted nucleic acid-binding protein